MLQWWRFHPIIAPLPKGFFDEDKSHKEAKEWMNAATKEIDRLRKENEELQSNLDLLFEYDSNLLDALKRHKPSGEK